MPKNIFTPRDELVCGKLDKAEQIAKSLGSLDLIDLLHDIRFYCERMEQKLISRKKEAEEQAAIDEKKRVALLQKVVERINGHIREEHGILLGINKKLRDLILETKLEE
ncbi:MAG: hypothetical protein M0R48_11460 [Candidatus Omnitrophica bacterium]|nr:hypothetical protein [Candidatus Omnitrophota bacterium]